LYKRMIFVKKTKYIALLMIAVLLLSACGKGDDNKKQNKNDNSAITLQMKEISNFNPFLVSNHSVRDVYSLCYEPLFAVDNTIHPQGVLAQSIDISDDCMTAVINLKDSVLWHDGVGFTGGDVIYTINLLKANPDWEYYEYVKYIDTVTVIDDYTLRITLTKPYGQIAYSLTFPIVAAHNTAMDSSILGTGPYKFSSYIPATSLELVKNEAWHGGDANCEKINVNIIKDNVAVTTAFNTGILSAVTDQSFDSENASPRAGSKTYSYPSTEFEYIALNHNKGIFQSQNIRSAVSYAIDRTTIVNECYNGGAMEANAPIHPAAEGVAESSIQSQFSLANANEMLFMEGYTMDESTKLLKDSQNNTLSFTLLVNEDNPQRMKTAQLLVKQFFAAGIDVNVTALPFEEYLERISSGNFDAYLGGTRLRNVYDFDALLSENGALNNYGYKSEYIEMALDALNTAPGQDSLSDAVFNFEELFVREQPVIGLLFKNRTLLVAENVNGDILPSVNAPYKNIDRWSVN